jgi:imidazoleglycerol phosphate synthase glutamine amidotransferase subunit HisH
VFPVWGTCLGHQLLSYLTNDYQNTLSPIRGQTAILNTIQFVSSDKGWLFTDLYQKLLSKLTAGQGITYFNHHYAITRSTYDSNKKLNTFWSLIG